MPAVPVAVAPQDTADDDDDADEGPLDTPWDDAPEGEYIETLPVEAMEPVEDVTGPTDFDGDWSALVARLAPRLGAARMLAHNAVLKDWGPRRLALAVPESFRHLTGRDYQEKLRHAVSDAFGQPVELVVTIEELGRETPAMQEARYRQEQQQAARECLQNDPVVQQFVREFNATLLTETIQPVQEL
ncbi:hypothetical protein GKE73_01055 [Paludibacterium sp. dN 18-1]|uniref:DNA polymerase III tau subunit domain-containing protein n=1 Tax=Paludibacterium denitrificans TaxID=2675226 RepID=A0A844GAR1_9NEIS|nr:DNA polymerase III subunit gamma/tau C-terminal domain-containing protein [Paludibacterium denitrificans]MTD32381.1 hypothetical protein [Paludibacterium denitrificans]